MKIFVNALTILRIISTFILPFFMSVIKPEILIVLVIILLLTDFFDGFLARTFKVQTLFGMISDTVADKLFGIVMLIFVATSYNIYFVAVFLELSIALINLTAAFRGATTKSSFLGKVKMWLLSLSTIIALILIFDTTLQAHMSNPHIINFLNTLVLNEETFIASAVSITIGGQLIVIADYLRHIYKELSSKDIKVVYNFKSKKEIIKVLFDTKYYLKNKNSSMSKHFLKS